jgi:heat shock protein HslJ
MVMVMVMGMAQVRTGFGMMMGAIATTLPLWLSPVAPAAWAQTACDSESSEVSYETEAGWIYICNADNGLTYTGPELNTDESVTLPAVPWNGGYQAIADDVLYRVNVDSFQILELSTEIALSAEVLQAVENRESALIGQVWQLQTVRYNNDETLVIEEPERYTIEFLPEGAANIQADCNRAGASYIQNDSSLTIEIERITRVACPPDSVDDEFLRDLENAAIYFIRDGKLYIDLMADGGTMEFAPASAPASDLVGIQWQLQQVQFNNDELITIGDPSLYTLEFLPDDEVAVRADCNRAVGTYTQTGSQLSITLGPTTLAACPPGSFSDRYLQTLQGAAGYFIDDGNLYIDLKVDTGTMMFAPAEMSLSREALCAIVSELPDAGNVEEVLATLNIDLEELIENQRALRIVMERLDAEGYGWQNVLGGSSPDVQLQPWLIAALRLACEDD